jgi:hypothetical protein
VTAPSHWADCKGHDQRLSNRDSRLIGTSRHALMDGERCDIRKILEDNKIHNCYLTSRLEQSRQTSLESLFSKRLRIAPQSHP